MTGQKRKDKYQKNIALVAHDNKKKDLLDWIKFNRDILTEHNLLGTGTTGTMIQEETGLEVYALQSGPLGGDLQMGSKISKGDVDILIFFWDPLEAQPHDPDIRALLRITAVWNIPVACNRATADYMISSDLIHKEYKKKQPNYSNYKNRLKDKNI